MSNFRYIYDSSVKWDCPSCYAKKRFVRYRDTLEEDTSKCWVEYPYGYCDRIESCGHNVKIDNESEIRNEVLTASNFNKNLKPINEPTVVSGNTLHISWYKQIKDNEYLIEDLEEKYQKPVLAGAYDDIIEVKDDVFKYKNVFIRCLWDIFPKKDVVRVAKSYGLMTFIDGGIVYPYFNYGGELITGKIMHYDKSLKRIKEGNKSYPNWLHSCRYFGEIQNKVVYVDDFNYNLTLFGFDDTIRNYKTIGVVEAEKTALILSVIFPEIRWLAAGSITNIQQYKFSLLNNKDIIIMPDLGWNKQKDMSIIDYWYYTIKNYTDYHIGASELFLIDYIPSWFSDKKRKMSHDAGNDPADFILSYKQKDQRLYDKYIGELRNKINEKLKF